MVNQTLAGDCDLLNSADGDEPGLNHRRHDRRVYDRQLRDRIQGCHRGVRPAPGSDLVRHGPGHDDLGAREQQEVEELGVCEQDERGCVDRWSLSQG
jgi:hypothetical protein